MIHHHQIDGIKQLIKEIYLRRDDAERRPMVQTNTEIVGIGPNMRMAVKTVMIIGPVPSANGVRRTGDEGSGKEHMGSEERGVR